MGNGNLEDTIVAVSTPIGEGGIGIVRLSGPMALKIVDDIFVSKDGRRPSQYMTYTTHYGHIIDRKQRTENRAQRSEVRSQKSERKGLSSDEVIDEVILTVMRAPKSYTKEDIVEVNCHGGIQAVKKILELVVRCGARVAEPGEFTKRAFLSGRIDLVQAEAVLDIIKAKTERSLKVAMGQLEGDFSKKVIEVRDKIIDIASHVEASIDFPDEGLDVVEEKEFIERIEDLLSELRSMIDTFSDGLVLREGILVIICGKPNVGKSSLMNLLLKRDRVIVSSIPGTTRDAVEEMINLKGIPIRLVDTAGIVETQTFLEVESVKKAKGFIEQADLVLLLLDGSTEIGKEDLDIVNLVRDKKRLVLINKIDLVRRIDENRVKDIFKNDAIIKISVKRKENIELLEKVIMDMVWEGNFDQAEGVIVTNARHKELLEKTFENISTVNNGLRERTSAEFIAVDLKEAIFNLGLIVGRSVSGDVLDRIFENFCIGK